MPASFPQIGNKVTAKILETQGDCTIAMKPDDEFDLSVHKCGDSCGYFYHNAFNWVSTLQFGGTLPAFEDPDVQVWECPNAAKRVKAEPRREKA